LLSDACTRLELSCFELAFAGCCSNEKQQKTLDALRTDVTLARMPADLFKLLGLDIVGKAYEDLVHPLAAEVGKLIATPLRVVNIYGDRVVAMATEAAKAVPPERQIPALPSIAGPILENVKYLEEGNPLLDLYQKLLTQLIDRDGVANAHPAFPSVIQQLSPDEAWFLFCMSKGPVARASFVTTGSGFEQPPKFVYGPALTSRLLYPQLMATYLNRMMLLGLVEMHLRVQRVGARIELPFDLVVELNLPDVVPSEELVNVYELRLSDFGKLFAKACIPDEWNSGAVERDDGT
jgi:hypothetical protein